MIINNELKPSLEETLEHHGVRGMKWGVRRGGLQSRAKGAIDDSFQRRITTANAIAGGKAKPRDVFRTATTTATVIPSKKLAARRSRVLNERVSRIDKGEAKVSDLLSVIGHVSYSDLVVSRRDKRGS